MIKKSVLALYLFGVALAAPAAPLTFDFKDPKGVNNAVFKLDAPLEAINGSANGVTGTVTFDPQNPGATKGKIIIASATLHVPNPMMKEHLHGAQWLDVTKHPEIIFETKELRNAKADGPNRTSAEVTGTMTIRGVSREMTVPITLTYLQDKLGQRVPNLKGDLLVIRANFVVSRKDFGINPNAPEDKVADNIDLAVSIAGAAPRP